MPNGTEVGGEIMTWYNIRLRLTVVWSVVLALLVGPGPAQAASGSWTVVSSPSPGGLNGVAAVTANNIWAVGDGPNGTLIEHWNGASWMVVPSPSPNPTDSVLNAVSAFCSVDVWAVGYYNSSTTGSFAYKTLIEHYNGTSWSVVPSPNAGTGSNFLTGVTALAFNDAWAVGYYYAGPGASQTLIEHWNGTSWSVVPSPNPGNNGGSVLRAVSAVSASDIWAVGYYLNVASNGVHRLIEHYDGTRWSIVPSADPAGAQVSHLSGVAAASSTDVWAVGDYSTNVEAGYYTLIEHWNGTSWSIVSGPTTHNGLNAVAAVSTGDVWAVGGPQGPTAGALIEHWNGTSWSAVPSAYPAGLGPMLNGVTAVPGASVVWAVGTTETTNNTFNTLIERGTAYAPNSWDCTQGNTSPACAAADLPPTVYERFELAAATGPDGRIYAIDAAGFNPAIVEAYRPGDTAWTRVASTPLGAIGLAAATGPDGRIYAIGGNDGSCTNAVQAYTPGTNTWTLVAPLHTARADLAAATGADGRIYAFGGDLCEDALVSAAEAYTVATNTWTNVAPPPTARAALTAAAGPDGKIYVIGGLDSTIREVATVEAYDPRTNTWTCSAGDPAPTGCAARTLAPMPTARADLAAAVGPDGRIYVVGGFDGTNALATVEAYDVTTNSWTCSVGDAHCPASAQVLAPMPTARSQLAATTGPDGRIYAIDGQGQNPTLSGTTTVEAYTPPAG